MALLVLFCWTSLVQEFLASLEERIAASHKQIPVCLMKKSCFQIVRNMDETPLFSYVMPNELITK